MRADSAVATPAAAIAIPTNVSGRTGSPSTGAEARAVTAGTSSSSAPTWLAEVSCEQADQDEHGEHAHARGDPGGGQGEVRAEVEAPAEDRRRRGQDDRGGHRLRGDRHERVDARGVRASAARCRPPGRRARRRSARGPRRSGRWRAPGAARRTRPRRRPRARSSGAGSTRSWPTRTASAVVSSGERPRMTSAGHAGRDAHRQPAVDPAELHHLQQQADERQAGRAARRERRPCAAPAAR